MSKNNQFTLSASKCENTFKNILRGQDESVIEYI
jgi:hypothetical protein